MWIVVMVMYLQPQYCTLKNDSDDRVYIMHVLPQ
jgi:hypothetical protein